MNIDDFTNLLQRFTELDMDKMDVEDNLQVTLAIMKFLKEVTPIIDKYVPDITHLPENEEFKFNEFWRFIDGEQDGE